MTNEVDVELLNDDLTPMEFVVNVLQELFHYDREGATRTMLKVHHEGSAVLARVPRAEGEVLVDAVASRAKAQGHPLTCRTIEPSPTYVPDRSDGRRT